MRNPKRIANELIRHGLEVSDDPLTHLQIQKLLYYCQGWALAIYKEPLMDGEFEVWRYGPVEPSVYYSLNHNRGGPVTELIPLHESDDVPLTGREQALVNRVLEVYGGKSGLTLSTKTHAPGTPWREARNRGLSYIPQSLLRDHFVALAKKNA